MILTLESSPPAGFDVVRQYAPRLLGESVVTALASEPVIAQPFQIWVDVIKKNGVFPVSKRIFVAWRYLLFEDDRVLGAADVAADSLEWRAFHPPEYAGVFIETVRYLERVDGMQRRLRLLLMPHLGVSALWLLAPPEASATDLFVLLPVTWAAGFEGNLPLFDQDGFADLVLGLNATRLESTGDRGA